VPKHQADFSWQQDHDRAILAGPGIRLAFARTRDRWTHRLEIDDGGDGIAIAWAIESEPDDSASRIISPVYQEHQRHERTAQPSLCLLLTGRLFHHHFSAAVSLRGVPEPPGGLVFDFDIADRCRAPLEALAATYAVGIDRGARVEAGPDRIAWSTVGPLPGRLELLAETPATLALAEAGRRATRVQALAALEPGTFTHRLRYRWRWTRAAPRTR
jgi:hypothetical protein